jgi:CRP/FNR family transcriptional regulator, cyclic AMP receptor protein
VDGIPDAAVDHLERSLPMLSWARARPMPEPLRLPDQLYVVRAGALALLEPAISGQMVMTALLEVGAIYSTLGGARPIYGLALEDSVVSPIPAAALEDLIGRFPLLGRNLAVVLSDRVTMLRETVAIVSEMRVEDRLLARIHQLAQRFGVAGRQGVRVRLTLTHHQWGLSIGASREAVTSAFGRLRARGLVVVSDREVTIPWEVVRELEAASEGGNGDAPEGS